MRMPTSRYVIAVIVVCVVASLTTSPTIAADPDPTTQRPFKKLVGHRDGVRSVAFDADGRFLISTGDLQEIILWDLSTSKVCNRIKDDLISTELVQHPGSKHFFSFAISSLREYRIGPRQPNEKATSPTGQSHDGPTLFDLDKPSVDVEDFWEGQAVAFSPDGHLTALGYTNDGKRRSIAGNRTTFPALLIVRQDKGKDIPVDRAIRELIDKSDINAMAFTRDSSSLVIVGSGRDEKHSGFIMLADVSATRVSLRTKPLFISDPINCVALSPDGNMFAVGTGDTEGKELKGRSNVLVFFSPGLLKKAEFLGSAGFVSTLAFSPDSTELYVGGDQRDIHVYSTRDWKLTKKLVGHTARVTALRVSNNGKLLGSGSADRSIIIWKIEK